jgi:undecaprenyl diphosphate synthase
LLEAIEDYQRRERRYGGLGDGTESDDVSSLPANTVLVPR